VARLPLIDDHPVVPRPHRTENGMAVTGHTEALDAATGLVARAHTKALVEARAQPDSTWIDAACAIGAAHAQLLAAHPAAHPAAPADGAERHTCAALLEQAAHALAGIPPGQGPVSLALARAYLTDAILETAGREP